jgi:hypothetical protein
LRGGQPFSKNRQVLLQVELSGEAAPNKKNTYSQTPKDDCLGGTDQRGLTQTGTLKYQVAKSRQTLCDLYQATQTNPKE